VAIDGDDCGNGYRTVLSLMAGSFGDVKRECLVVFLVGEGVASCRWQILLIDVDG